MHYFLLCLIPVYLLLDYLAVRPLLRWACVSDKWWAYPVYVLLIVFVVAISAAAVLALLYFGVVGWKA